MATIRTPPIEIRRALRAEVGFGCPVPGCGNPYLEWHHFDPPWHVRQHHDLPGMIALCAEHHAKADAGAFTEVQLREFKASAHARIGAVAGRFDWMRNRVLAVVGGSFYYETPIILSFRGAPVVWFNRDDSGSLLLNLRMLTTSKEPRLILEDSFWLVKGSPVDFECPPNGQFISAEYSNGDRLTIQYRELNSATETRVQYPHSQPDTWDIAFPVTAVEVTFKVGGTEIDFGPTRAVLPGQGVVQGMFAKNCRTGLALA